MGRHVCYYLAWLIQTISLFGTSVAKQATGQSLSCRGSRAATSTHQVYSTLLLSRCFEPMTPCREFPVVLGGPHMGFFMRIDRRSTGTSQKSTISPVPGGMARDGFIRGAAFRVSTVLNFGANGLQESGAPLLPPPVCIHSKTVFLLMPPTSNVNVSHTHYLATNIVSQQQYCCCCSRSVGASRVFARSRDLTRSSSSTVARSRRPRVPRQRTSRSARWRP